MEIVLAAPPSYYEQAVKTGFKTMLLSYKTAENGVLYKPAEVSPSKYGMINFELKKIDNRISDLIINECRKYNISGAALSCEQVSNTSGKFVCDICSRLGREGISVYVPSSFPQSCIGIRMYDSCITGGSYEDYLKSTKQKNGATALLIDIMCCDFLLPSKSGVGRDLSQAEYNSIRTSTEHKSYFSKELYTNYFWYRKNGDIHFILYDTSMTIRQKLLAAKSFGIDACFLYYPQVSGMLTSILGK